ncbi:D-sorbitol dehydrogenase [Xylophilus rhododendri]|uniref:D-sorbitol dehydrogenase n=1 Tax=Xylophilus rhododendri TaxID=2697032 RepID=A0A857J1D0_9BURK|nr:sugar dehydrogenase complex small subunit [Xylophilus rhododendri]QHI97714.1 D-sorbitol dehydrogenase [Xylophilus rhododendri]
MTSPPSLRRPATDYSQQAGGGHPGITRRQLGMGAISLVVIGAGLRHLQTAGAASNPAEGAVHAPAETADFLAFSTAITGHKDLDSITAGRICAAMLKASAEFAGQLKTLSALATPGLEPKAVLAQADSAGLRGTALSIVAAWYTGTVGSGPGATMVAYAKALMYRPIADGMTVPTYCNYGPGWWTAAPPPVGVSPPVEPKPVAAPPTTGTPTPASNPPKSPKTTPSATGAAR